jgi:hypothetical protein
MKAVGHALRWMPLLRAVGYSQTVTFGNTFIGQGVERGGSEILDLLLFRLCVLAHRPRISRALD